MKYKVRGQYVFFGKNSRIFQAGEIIDDQIENVKGQVHKLEDVPGEVKTEAPKTAPAPAISPAPAPAPVNVPATVANVQNNKPEQPIEDDPIAKAAHAKTTAGK